MGNWCNAIGQCSPALVQPEDKIMCDSNELAENVEYAGTCINGSFSWWLDETCAITSNVEIEKIDPRWPVGIWRCANRNDYEPFGIIETSPYLDLDNAVDYVALAKIANSKLPGLEVEERYVDANEIAQVGYAQHGREYGNAATLRDQWTTMTSRWVQDEEEDEFFGQDRCLPMVSLLKFDVWGDWSADMAELQPRQRVTKKVRRVRTQYPAEWNSLVKYDPQVEGDCLFDCVATGIGYHMTTGEARQWCLQLWNKDENWNLLCEVARQEHESPQGYLAAVAKGRWGGFPEAMVMSKSAGVRVCAWDGAGALVYSTTCEHATRTIHLGYTGSHYVLLHRPRLSWRISASSSQIRAHVADIWRWPGRPDGMVYAGGAGDRGHKVASSTRGTSRKRSRTPLTPARTENDYEKLRKLRRVQGVEFSEEATWITLKFWGDSTSGGYEPFCSLCSRWLDKTHRLSEKHQSRIRHQGAFVRDPLQQGVMVEEGRAIAEAIRGDRQDGDQRASSIVLIPGPGYASPSSEPSCPGKTTTKPKAKEEVRGENEGKKGQQQEGLPRHEDSMLEAESSWYSWRSLDRLHERLHCDLCGEWASRHHRDSSRHRRRLRQHSRRQPATVDDMLGNTDDLIHEDSGRGGTAKAKHDSGCRQMKCKGYGVNDLMSCGKAVDACASSSLQSRTMTSSPQISLRSGTCWPLCRQSPRGTPESRQSSWSMASSWSGLAWSRTTSQSVLRSSSSENPGEVSPRWNDIGEAVSVKPKVSQLANVCQVSTVDKQGMVLGGGWCSVRGGVGGLPGSSGPTEISPTVPFAGEVCTAHVSLTVEPSSDAGHRSKKEVFGHIARKLHGKCMQKGTPRIHICGAPLDPEISAQPLEHAVSICAGYGKVCEFVAPQTALVWAVAIKGCQQIPTIRGRYVFVAEIGDDLGFCWGKKDLLKVRLEQNSNPMEAASRGGMFDHTAQEQFTSLASRVRTLRELVSGVESDLESLRKRVCSRPTRPASQSASSSAPPADASAQLSRVAQEQEVVFVDDVPGILDMILPLIEELHERPEVEGGERQVAAPADEGEDEVAYRRSGEGLHSLPAGELPGPPEPDQGELDLGHAVHVRMGEKGRRSYDMSYIAPTDYVSDLHYEVARVALAAGHLS